MAELCVFPGFFRGKRNVDIGNIKFADDIVCGSSGCAITIKDGTEALKEDIAIFARVRSGRESNGEVEVCFFFVRKKFKNFPVFSGSIMVTFICDEKDGKTVFKVGEDVSCEGISCRVYSSLEGYYVFTKKRKVV